MGSFVVAGLAAGMRHIRKWRPDILHVHFAVPSGPVAWSISRWTGIPYVLTAHLGDVPGGVPEKTDAWFRWFYRFTPPIWHDAAQVVAVSDFTRQLAGKHYPVDMQVLPNGVDLTSLDPGSIQTGNPPHIVFAGRFVPQKNPLQLVQTLNDIRQLAWQCTLMGDGPLRPEVEAEIQRLALADRVKTTGWVTPEEVITQFRASDILFMPSLSEGFPVVGVQAIAMGLAVVGSQVGGMVDIVSNGHNGFLYDPQDRMGMAKGLTILLNDAQVLLAARQKSRELSRRFDLETVVNGYEQIFTQTLVSLPVLAQP
jgi:glycosyltransferase involved in cell wall biosynthesis